MSKRLLFKMILLPTSHKCSAPYIFIYKKKINVFSLFQIHKCDLKVAVIGQSSFAAEVYKLLKKNGHSIVGVFTIVDKVNREDILGKPNINDDEKYSFTIHYLLCKILIKFCPNMNM